MNILYASAPLYRVFFLSGNFILQYEQSAGEDLYYLRLEFENGTVHPLTEPMPFAKVYRLLKRVVYDIGKNVPVDIESILEELEDDKNRE